MLCMWLDQESIVYYEFLKSDETIASKHYQQRQFDLNCVLNKNLPVAEINDAK